MNKEFIPYEQALELKELGFDKPCFGEYRQWDGNEPWLQLYQDLDGCSTDPADYEYTLEAKAPTFSQAFRWFREKHNLVHEISWSKYKGGLNFDYDVFSLVLPTDAELGDEDDIASDKSMEIYDSLVDKDFRHKESDIYEEAELACLIKLIEIVKL
jgi:hypothetical protein